MTSAASPHFTTAGDGGGASTLNSLSSPSATASPACVTLSPAVASTPLSSLLPTGTSGCVSGSVGAVPCCGEAGSVAGAGALGGSGGGLTACVCVRVPSPISTSPCATARPTPTAPSIPLMKPSTTGAADATRLPTPLPTTAQGGRAHKHEETIMNYT